MAMSLSPETQNLIELQMTRGRYSSPDELVRAALKSLVQQQRDPLSDMADAEIEALYPGMRQKKEKGLADADAGKVSDGEAFFAELVHQVETYEKQGRKTA